MDNKLYHFRQFIKFCAIGVINTTIDFGIYFFLTRFTGLTGTHIYVANAISFCAAATFSLFANKRFTFDRADKVTLNETIKFFATAISGFALGTLTLFMLVEHLGFHDLVAKVGATGVTVIWNFLISKFWVFTDEE